MWAELWESCPDPVNLRGGGVTGWAWVPVQGWLREPERPEVSWVTPSEQRTRPKCPGAKGSFQAWDQGELREAPRVQSLRRCQSLGIKATLHLYRPERELPQMQWVTWSQRPLPFRARDASLEHLVSLAPLLMDTRLSGTSLGRVTHAQHQQHPGAC